MQHRKKVLKHYERQTGCVEILFHKLVNKMQG